ncbi:MAG: hypothetical protein MO852_06850 [Candidatus Devosia euplotis]|nr:hypothetical protein [Candidatus Devosia euplotis]
MSLAQEMFAIAPALEKANLSASQLKLLSGKARWIFRVGEAGFPTVPAIALTRAAWEALQSERSRKDVRLRAHWVPACSSWSARKEPRRLWWCAPLLPSTMAV